MFMPAPRPVEKRLDVFGDMVDHWICYQCNQWYPLHEMFFVSNKTKRFGLDGLCKDCKKLKRYKYQLEENKERWFKSRSNDAKQRAKRKGIDFDLNFDDLQYPDFCPFTKLELTYALTAKENYKGMRAEAASLDRIDSSKGYVAGNVRVVSWYYNSIKNSFSDAFTKKMCKNIADNIPDVAIL